MKATTACLESQLMLNLMIFNLLPPKTAPVFAFDAMNQAAFVTKIAKKFNNRNRGREDLATTKAA
jgi:hypothetical protein